MILGKSMTLHREPVAAIRRMVDDLGIACVVMYDMAHVLGLAGPVFRSPLRKAPTWSPAPPTRPTSVPSGG